MKITVAGWQIHTHAMLPDGASLWGSAACPTWLERHPEYAHWQQQPGERLLYTPLVRGTPEDRDEVVPETPSEDEVVRWRAALFQNSDSGA